MNEYWLVLSFIILSCMALPLIVYPLRQSKKLMMLSIPILSFGLVLAYSHWGSWSDWQKSVRNQANKQKIEAVLQTIKGPAELIDKMKMRLSQDPKSSKGWYLLGRLYASQNQWQEAKDAFTKAHQLDPEDELAHINYINSLWQLNQQQLSEQIREQLKQLLQKHPNQPDALAMLAMDAFKKQDYQLAINYWQQLLKLAPEQSEDAQMIRKAIAKAQANLSK